MRVKKSYAEQAKRKARKARRKQLDEALVEQAKGLAEIASQAHDCRCAWCCWREYQTMVGKADPGMSIENSAENCTEPQTVELRGKLRAFAVSMAGLAPKEDGAA